MAKYRCKTQSAIPTDEGATTATAKSAGGRLGNSATRQQNKAIGDYLQQKGWTVTGGGGQVKEEYLPPLSGKGRAGSNYIDITATKTTSHGEVTIRTTCTGANTSHTFSSTNSKCARCGYVRTYIIPTLLTPMAKNTQITLTARTNHTVSSISMSVKNPNGATTNLGTVTNTTSISKVYTPTVAAHPNDLYTVTVTAVSADGVTTSSTWTFRTY